MFRIMCHKNSENDQDIFHSGPRLAFLYTKLVFGVSIKSYWMRARIIQESNSRTVHVTLTRILGFKR